MQARLSRWNQGCPPREGVKLHLKGNPRAARVICTLAPTQVPLLGNVPQVLSAGRWCCSYCLQGSNHGGSGAILMKSLRTAVCCIRRHCCMVRTPGTCISRQITPPHSPSFCANPPLPPQPSAAMGLHPSGSRREYTKGSSCCSVSHRRRIRQTRQQ